MSKKNISIFELFELKRAWFKWEALEQALLVQFLELSGYKYTAIPNSTYTTSIKQKIVNKVTWVNAWLCDLIIILKCKKVLFIELKKKRTFKKNWDYSALSSDWINVSEAQKEWIKELNFCDWVTALVCFGFLEAKETILQQEKTT